jgi:CheY-like chemotaxis protein
MTVPGPCVLVVDNDPVHRELAAALLQIALPNAAVTGAACGFEALISIGQQDFDLVIADVVMSNMNGFKMLLFLLSLELLAPGHTTFCASS